ncbi:hypothetical protein ACOME3_010301 [Neoechinorhynchus agilis]
MSNANRMFVALQNDELEDEFEWLLRDRTRLVVVNLKEFNDDNKATYPFAGFLVPFHSARKWQYRTKNGRKSITRQASVKRMIFIYPTQQSFDFDQIQKDFGEVSANFKPRGIPENYSIPIMSAQKPDEEIEDLKETDHFGNGVYTVKVTHNDGREYKRLIIASSGDMSQTEMLLTCNGVTFEPDAKGYVQVMTWIISDYLQKLSVLLIGLGGGELCHGLLLGPKLRTILALDSSQDVIRISNSKLKGLSTKCVDGISYLRSHETQYDVVVVDVDQLAQENGLACPSDEFINPEVINLLRSHSKTATIINCLDHSDSKLSRDLLLRMVNSTFEETWLLETNIDDESTGDNELIIGWVGIPPPLVPCELKYVDAVLNTKVVYCGEKKVKC